MATDYKDFLPEIMPEVIGCPVPVVVNAIRNTVIEFCKKSTWLRQDLDPISITATYHTYDLEPPTDTRVASLTWVGYAGEEITRKAESQLDYIDDKWPSRTGVPKYYFLPTMDEIRVVPTPESNYTDGLTLRAALCPTPASTECDSGIYNDWHEEIAAGAKMRLMAMRKKPWSDKAQSDYYGMQFADAVARAKRAAEASNHKRLVREVGYGGI